MEFISIFVKDNSETLHEIKMPNDPAYSLMEMLRSSELPVLGTCDGLALCASCHVYVHSQHNLSDKCEEELILLDSLLNSHDNSRLSCQIKMDESLHNLIIEIAPE